MKSLVSETLRPICRNLRVQISSRQLAAWVQNFGELCGADFQVSNLHIEETKRYVKSPWLVLECKNIQQCGIVSI